MQRRLCNYNTVQSRIVSFASNIYIQKANVFALCVSNCMLYYSMNKSSIIMSKSSAFNGYSMDRYISWYVQLFIYYRCTPTFLYQISFEAFRHVWINTFHSYQDYHRTLDNITPREQYYSKWTLNIEHWKCYENRTFSYIASNTRRILILNINYSLLISQ